MKYYYLLAFTILMICATINMFSHDGFELVDVILWVQSDFFLLLFYLERIDERLKNENS